MKLSIILPVYNEAGSLKELYNELKRELDTLNVKYEVIAVNDGSRDASQIILEELATNDTSFRVIHLSKNYGQTAAMSAGIDSSTGEVIIPMDSDLQNDPSDIRKFLITLEEGYDVVSGWRKNRKDTFMRRLPSLLANKLISNITSVKLHDYGCTMKAYRREVIQDVRFYGEMHRFMPAYVAWHGARITEIVVNHRARKYDVSKYGISRTFRVILDLLTVKFLMTYLTKPIHFFGGVGLSLYLLSFLAGVFAILLRIDGVHFIRTPLPLLAVFLAITGTQFILMGILAEIMIRVYHEPQGKSTYAIRNKINFKDGTA